MVEMMLLGYGGIIKAVGAEKAFIILMSGSIAMPEIIKHLHTIKQVLVTYPNAHILYDVLGKLLR